MSILIDMELPKWRTYSNLTNFRIHGNQYGHHVVPMQLMKQLIIFTERDRIIALHHQRRPPREIEELTDSSISYIRKVCHQHNAKLEKM